MVEAVPKPAKPYLVHLFGEDALVEYWFKRNFVRPIALGMQRRTGKESYTLGHCGKEGHDRKRCRLLLRRLQLRLGLELALDISCSCDCSSCYSYQSTVVYSRVAYSFSQKKGKKKK